MTSASRRTAAASLAALAFATSGIALADDVRACVAASDRAQVLRDEGKLKLAREQMIACSREACPAVVRKDCTTWLSSLDASMPSVVIGARDAAGKDLVRVRVSVDGSPLLEALDGKALPIDPGAHTFRFELPGEKPLEVPFVIREGEQRRALFVQFPPKEAPPPPPPSAAKVPVAPIVLGVLGVAALANFAAFGVWGRNELLTLHATCGIKHDCSDAQVNDTRTKLIVADVSLGTGIAAIATGAIVLIVGRLRAAPQRGSAFTPGFLTFAGGALATGSLRF
jgi:hypothetical protein